MNLKTSIELEVKKDERSYRFYIPAGAPLGEAYDAAFEALEAIFKLATEGKERAEARKEEIKELEAKTKESACATESCEDKEDGTE